MNTLWWVNIVVILLAAISPTSHGISKRTVYTLFTEGHTWNEAKVICEGQFGQLLKVKSDRQLYELRYLDDRVWSGAIQDTFTSGMHVWTGLHTLAQTGDKVYQDCETQSTNVTITSGASATDLCAALQDWNALQFDSCNKSSAFVCQRQEGDCWYDPYVDESALAETSHGTVAANNPTECAVTCRNYVIGEKECWGFTFSSASGVCTIHYVSTSDALNTSNTSPSVFYLQGNRVGVASSDTVFYTRICIEGTLDTVTYGDVINEVSVPESVCTSTVYEADPTDDSICFCTSTVQPTIPEPKTTDQKVQELVQELTINTKNTSSSQRKLSSADDSRQSAMSVGYVGIALLLTVFGGLFLLDVTVLYSGLRALLSALKQ